MKVGKVYATMQWLCLMSFILAALAQTPKPPPPAPQQPLPFSHKIHAGTLKLKCNMCHPNKDPGDAMGIAAASVCMQCHSAVKTESPAVQKLTEFRKANREIKWVRVYQIPSYVFFSHRAHLETGNTCAECHGSIAERDQLYREGDISMGGCMNCHRTKKVSNDCTYCHEQR